MMSDMNEWVSEPSPQGDYYEHPEKYEQDHRFSQEAIEEDRGSLPTLLLPVAFFFMPGRFMRSYGVHMHTGTLFMVIWITGIASLISSLENRSLTGGSSVLAVDTWAFLWGLGIVGGILRGLVVHGLGGLWYRLRLKMCGQQSAEWKLTGRVYMVSGIAKQLAYILNIAYATTVFASFEAYVQDDGSDLVWTFGYLAIAMILQISSSITLFCGSVAVFQLKKVWAVVWLLVLPILLRVVATSAIFAVSWIGTFTPRPQITTPSQYEGSMIEMEYPRNWMIYEDETNPGPQFWVQSVPLIGDAIIEIELVYQGESLEMFSYAEEGWLDRVDYELGEIREEGDTRYAGKLCSYRDRTVTLSGTNYVMKLLHWELSDRSGVLVSMIAPSSAWDTAEIGFEHIVQTLKVQDPITTPPDLKQTYTARLEEIQFVMPGNWWLDRELYDDTTHEDGTVSKGTRYLEAESSGNAVFRTYLYESGLGPRSELANSIEGYTQDGRLENEQTFGDWNGMSGFGAHGHATLGDIYYHITVFVTELDDGRILEIRELIAADQESIHSSGIKLIEDTFELRMPEPESEPESP